MSAGWAIGTLGIHENVLLVEPVLVSLSDTILVVFIFLYNFQIMVMSVPDERLTHKSTSHEISMCEALIRIKF